jgi:type I restriction enzyme, S subunit
MSEWAQLSIKDNAYLRGRIGWQGLRADEFVEEGPYLVTGTDFDRGRVDWSSCYHVTDERFREAVPIQLREDDLLVTKDGTIGKIAQVRDCPEKAVLNSGVFLLRCADGSFQHRFLYHVLTSHHFDKFLRQNLAGSTINHLYQYVFELFSFAAPDDKKQAKICRIFDLLDIQIEATEALIAKQERVRAGLMQDLFTRGVDEYGQLRPPRDQAPHLYHQTELGWLPLGWEVRPAHRLCSSVIDCKNRTPLITSEGHPVFRTPNVRNGRFVIEGLVYTDSDSHREWTRRGQPLPGDILVTREAPVGEVCIIPSEFPLGCLGQRMMLYRPLAEIISSEFMVYALQSRQVQANLDRISGGSTVGHVRVGDIRDLAIPFCKEPEQRLITVALAGKDEVLDCERARVAKLRLQKSGLMQDLLTGKVSVVPLLQKAAA